MRKIEPLTRAHNRDRFDCGNEPLNFYLRQTARQHADRGISATFVIVDEDSEETILGFFTLNLCQLRSDELPDILGRKLPREIAGVKLSRLAVALAEQRKGIGQLLLSWAMEKVLEIFSRAGGIGLFVDAKDDSAKRYYERFGFVPLPSNELQLFLPLKTIQEALSNKQ